MSSPSFMDLAVSLGRDLRQAARRLRARPGISLLAVLALALGIGANTAVFSAVDAVLLAPLPFAEPERLVVLSKSQPSREVPVIEISHPELVDWQHQSTVFEKLAAHPSSVVNATITGRDEPLSVPSIAVTGDFFPLLGVEAAEGRLLGPADGRPGAPRTAVLSRALRQRLFGDAPAVGRSLTIDDQLYTVAGVLPSRFRYPEGAQLWLPLAAVVPPQVLEDRTISFLRVLGRLAPGVPLERAQAEMDTIVARLAREHEPGSPEQKAVLRPLAAEILGPARQALPLLSGVVFLVLLIACANVAHLLLASAEARQHELALRSALGASRAALVRQLLAEALVLALRGGLAGLGLAWLGLRVLPTLAPPEMPRLDEVHLGGRVLGFAFALSVLTVFVFGLLPALHATRLDLREALGESGGGSTRGPRGQRWMAALVAAEVAMAAVLLLCAGLLVGSFRHLSAIDPGFRPRGLLTAEVVLPESHYPELHQKEAFYDRLLERLRARPGVSNAAAVLLRPLEGEIGWDFPFTVEGQSQEQHEANPLSNFETISPGYFQTLGIPLRAGRDFDDRDRRDAEPVAIVNESFARRFWPGGALGRRIKVSEPAAPIPWRRIVGIAADARYRGLERSTLDFYVPYRQEMFFPAHVLVRTRAGDPLSLAGELREAVRELDPDQPVAGLTTMEERTAAQLAVPRFLMSLAGLFALLASVLAALGIFGLISYATTRRTREIGLRLALGSPRRAVLGLMARQGLLPALAGLAVGLPAAAALAGGLAGLLHGIRPGEPAVFAAVGLALLAVAAVASYVPALRATRIAPSTALRQE